MKLLNFDQADAIDEILEQVGVTSGVAEFFWQYLEKVLREKRPDVIIKSIEFIAADKCSLKGRETHEQQIIEVDSASIPFDTRAVLLTNANIHQVDLHVQIDAVASNGSWEVTTRFEVKEESIIGP